jgi:AcrR family transcriptional regulator
MSDMNDPDGGVSGSEPQLGRRARKALATRHAMFAAGLAAFENRPLGLVSVLDITEASDVAKGVFYLHFRGKDEYLIELWDFVRSRFLDALRDKLEATRARRARLEAVVAHYYAALVGAPRDCRFWLRMSSYFGDEVGQPGQMSRSREVYLQRLASLMAGVPRNEVGAAEIRAASVLDGASWGLISQSLQLGGAALDEPGFVRAVTSAVRALPRP